MSIYKTYTDDQIENLASNYLISSWSYSKVTQFARHEKAFERMHIYGYRAKSSATTVAGQAYHHALQWFFMKLRDGEMMELPDAEILAFNYIDEKGADEWKLQKTTPTMEEAKAKAIATVNKLLTNFYAEVKTYIDDIEEILNVECYFSEFLTINGVDIPLKANGMIDLIFRTKSGKIIITDHKSKDKYTDEKEVKFSIGKQAVTYYKALLSKHGLKADEVWFMENKHSKNKDAEPQIRPVKIKLDDNTIRLYEALLYEPLKKMLEAVSNPDYVYMINDSDNFEDLAEIYDFWAKTMIAEVDEFNVPDSKKPLIEKRLKKIRDVTMATTDPKIIKNFRKNTKEFIQYDLSQTDMTNEEKIEHVLRTKNVSGRVAHTFSGFSSNTYLLEFGAGVNINSVGKYRLDLASALSVPNIRISKDLKMHEGKSYLALDHSKKREADLLWDEKELVDMKIPIGKDNLGNTIIWDLENHSTPHVLVCGATGSGKTVSLISTIEYAMKLKDVERIIVCDPKYEPEFLKFQHSNRVEVYNEILDIEERLEELVEEMNKKVKGGKHQKTLVIIDEVADAFLSARKGKELDIYEDVVVGQYRLSAAAALGGAKPQDKIERQKVGERKSLEDNLQMLLQKGRSSGYRIISGLQRASVKILKGDLKVNYPVRICFYVPTATDSSVIIDEPGAEQLAGRGDFLIRSPQYSDIVRGQAFYKP